MISKVDMAQKMLFSIQLPEQASPIACYAQVVSMVTGDKAVALIAALKDAIKPAREADGNYVWKIKNLACEHLTNEAYDVSDMQYGIPSDYDCMSPQIQDGAKAQNIFNALSAIGGSPDDGMGHLGFSTQQVICRIHMNESDTQKRFGCEVDYQSE